MASRRVRIAARMGDIVRFQADVIGLKFQGHLSGATQHVARALGLSAAALQAAMPDEGMVHVVPGDGRITARHALFVRVPPASTFTYQHVRAFNAGVLRALRAHLPAARHVAVTSHGVGFDSDLEDSLSAIVRGCGDAIRAGEIPDSLEEITIVDRQLDDSAAVQRVLEDLAPGGVLAAPGVAVTPSSPPGAAHASAMPASSPATPAQDPVGTPSLFDIFLSFKSEDERYARQVYETLAANGLRVFFSRASLPRLGSDAYHVQIDRAIEHARHMVVVTSSTEHVTARWVQYEWRLFLGEQLAGRKPGNLITVIAGDMKIKDLPISLRHLEVLRCDADGLTSLVHFTRMDVDRAAPSPAALLTAQESRQVEGVNAGPSLIVAVRHVLWNTSWRDALEFLLTSREIDLSKGWRMPTLDELRAIRSLALLPADSCYWSSQEAAGDEACYLHFDDGHQGQGPKTFSHGVAAAFVKGPGVARAPQARPAAREAEPGSSWRLAATVGAPPGIALVRVSARGDLVVTGGVDGALRVYDPHTLSRRAVLGSRRYWAARHEALVTALALSPDGRYVASGHLDGSIHVWDIAGERELGSPAHEIAIGGLTFSPDSLHLVSGSRDGMVRVWEIGALEQGQGLAGAATKPASIVYLSCLPMSNWLVTGLVNTVSGRYALQIDKTARQDRTLATLNLGAPFKQMAISRDEAALAAAGGDGQVRLYDLAAAVSAIERKQNPKLLPLVAEFKAHGKAVSSLAYFPDGRSLATCAMTASLIVWDLDTRQPRLRLQGDGSDAFNGVAVVQDGSMLVGALADGRVRIWQTSR